MNKRGILFRDNQVKQTKEVVPTEKLIGTKFENLRLVEQLQKPYKLERDSP